MSGTYNPTPMAVSELAALSQYSVTNLVTPGATCLIHFAVPWTEEGKFVTVAISMPSEDLINRLAASAVQQLKLGSSYDQYYTGKYDLSFARLMATYASWIRNGADVGTYFIVGPVDVANLLANDPMTQGDVNNVLAANGFTGVSGMNGVPLVGATQFFVPKKSDLVGPEGEQLPPGTVVGYEDVVVPPAVQPGSLTTVGASDEKSSAYWWMVAGVAAAGAAAYGVVKMVKRGRR